jgi:hypothetical protein
MINRYLGISELNWQNQQIADGFPKFNIKPISTPEADLKAILG